jgi:hypothetical protein
MNAAAMWFQKSYGCSRRRISLIKNIEPKKRLSRRNPRPRCRSGKVFY